MSLLLAVGSGLVLAIANALSYDLYYRSLHLSASTERRILVARAAIVLVAALAAWAAYAASDAMPVMTGASFSLAASAFLPALLLGIWWKRATGEGALAGMLAGLAVCLCYMLAPRYIPFAFYETSSFLSNATPDDAARYVALRQGYYLADETARGAALAAWEASARGLANWAGVKRGFCRPVCRADRFPGDDRGEPVHAGPVARCAEFRRGSAQPADRLATTEPAGWTPIASRPH